MANNYDGIQHASVRVKIDPSFVIVQTELDEAWYGDKDENGRSDRSTGAKRGVRGRLWKGIEITSEVQFNRLSALVEARRVVAIVAENRADGIPYPDLDARGDAEEVARIASERGQGLDIDEILSRGP